MAIFSAMRENAAGRCIAGRGECCVTGMNSMGSSGPSPRNCSFQFHFHFKCAIQQHLYTVGTHRALTGVHSIEVLIGNGTY